MGKPNFSAELPAATLQQIEELKPLFNGNKTQIVIQAIKLLHKQETRTMNSKTYYVSEAMLGDEATEDDARRMVEILSSRGYDVEYGDRLGQDETDIPTAVWEEGLDIISQEKYA